MSEGVFIVEWKGFPRKLSKARFGKEWERILSAISNCMISFLLRDSVVTLATFPRKPRELLLKKNY